MNKISMEAAIMKIFINDPTKIFEIQEIYANIENHYKLSDFQKKFDPKHPAPRYHHEIRSIIRRLEKQGKITKLKRNQRKLAN